MQQNESPELKRVKGDLFSLIQMHQCPKCRLKTISIHGRCLKCGVRLYPDEVNRLKKEVERLTPVEVAK